MNGFPVNLPAEMSQRLLLLLAVFNTSTRPAVSRQMVVESRDVLAIDPDNTVQIIDHGVSAGSRRMSVPPFEARLSEQQVADIASYVRISWSNTAAPNANAAIVAVLRNGK